MTTCISKLVQVDRDGKLSLDVGPDLAGSEVLVSITAAAPKPLTQEQLIHALHDLSGAFPDFEVPDDTPWGDPIDLDAR
jgi:hypothetical protein